MKRIKTTMVMLVAGIMGVLLMSSYVPGEKVHIEGTLVDTKCYSMMPKANAGNDHMVKGHDGELMEMKGCATACANMGIPVGVLDKKGEMHVLSVPANQLAKHMAKEVRIDGMEAEGVILVEKIEVKEGNSWKEIKIATMM